jgi:hypothetical protein
VKAIRTKESALTDGKLISSDSHIVEPPDVWAERLDAKYRDRAPRVVAEHDGDWWIVDGVRTNSFQGGAQAGVRFESQDRLRPAARVSRSVVAEDPSRKRPCASTLDGALAARSGSAGTWCSSAAARGKSADSRCPRAAQA